VRDDAAAAARRIVEEVLARHEQEADAAPDTVAIPVPTPPAGETAERPAPSDPQEPADTHAQDDRPDAETELLAAAGEAASVASRIARRIVAEALAEADERAAQAPGGDRREPQPEVSVRGVPAEGLPVDDEQTVGIEVTEQPADTEDPPARGAAASASAGTATPAPGSAAEIVRRIVADVQAEASTPPADEPSSQPEEPGAAADEPSSQPEEPGAPADEPSSRTEAPAPEAEEHARRDVGSGTPPDEDGGSLSPAPEPKPDTTAVLEEQRPATTTVALPQQQAVGVGARPVAGFDGDPAPAATAASGRELEGWATPRTPGPSVTTASQDISPRTLRWLIASLLGAVALAVLFPLAVAALRALVAMD
jgi:hypothetical protein